MEERRCSPPHQGSRLCKTTTTSKRIAKKQQKTNFVVKEERDESPFLPLSARPGGHPARSGRSRRKTLLINSRVHPKKTGSREGGVATWVRVRRKELCHDVLARMPLRFLVPKYRLPQKKVKKLILRALEDAENEGERQLISKALNSDGNRTYEKDHPSRFALCLTEEERRYLMKDFHDDAILRRDVRRCLRLRTRRRRQEGRLPTSAQENLISCVGALSKEQRKLVLLLLKQLVPCFDEDDDDCDVDGVPTNINGMPSEIASSVLVWIIKLIKGTFDEIEPPSVDVDVVPLENSPEEEEEEVVQQQQHESSKDQTSRRKRKRVHKDGRRTSQRQQPSSKERRRGTKKQRTKKTTATPLQHSNDETEESASDRSLQEDVRSSSLGESSSDEILSTTPNDALSAETIRRRRQLVEPSPQSEPLTDNSVASTLANNLKTSSSSSGNVSSDEHPCVADPLPSSPSSAQDFIGLMELASLIPDRTASPNTHSTDDEEPRGANREEEEEVNDSLSFSSPPPMDKNSTPVVVNVVALPSVPCPMPSSRMSSELSGASPEARDIRPYDDLMHTLPRTQLVVVENGSTTPPGQAKRICCDHRALTTRRRRRIPWGIPQEREKDMAVQQPLPSYDGADGARAKISMTAAADEVLPDDSSSFATPAHLLLPCSGSVISNSDNDERPFDCGDDIVVAPLTGMNIPSAQEGEHASSQRVETIDPILRDPPPTVYSQQQEEEEEEAEAATINSHHTSDSIISSVLSRKNQADEQDPLLANFETDGCEEMDTGPCVDATLLASSSAVAENVQLELVPQSPAKPTKRRSDDLAIGFKGWDELPSGPRVRRPNVYPDGIVEDPERPKRRRRRGRHRSSKRKQDAKEELLTSSCSDLCDIDLRYIFTHEIWNTFLTEEERDRLQLLLPSVDRKDDETLAQVFTSNPFFHNALREYSSYQKQGVFERDPPRLNLHWQQQDDNEFDVSPYMSFRKPLPELNEENVSRLLFRYSDDDGLKDSVTNATQPETHVEPLAIQCTDEDRGSSSPASTTTTTTSSDEVLLVHPPVVVVERYRPVILYMVDPDDSSMIDDDNDQDDEEEEDEEELPPLEAMDNPPCFAFGDEPAAQSAASQIPPPPSQRIVTVVTAERHQQRSSKKRALTSRRRTRLKNVGTSSVITASATPGTHEQQ